MVELVHQGHAIVILPPSPPFLPPSLTHLLTPSLPPFLPPSLPPSLTHSLTPSLPSSLPHSLTHSLRSSHPPSQCVQPFIWLPWDARSRLYVCLYCVKKLLHKLQKSTGTRMKNIFLNEQKVGMLLQKEYILEE